jgi:hypothetical protein
MHRACQTGLSERVSVSRYGRNLNRRLRRRHVVDHTVSVSSQIVDRRHVAHVLCRPVDGARQFCRVPNGSEELRVRYGKKTTKQARTGQVSFQFLWKLMPFLSIDEEIRSRRRARRIAFESPWGRTGISAFRPLIQKEIPFRITLTAIFLGLMPRSLQNASLTQWSRGPTFRAAREQTIARRLRPVQCR